MIGIWKEKIWELEMKKRALNRRIEMLENEIIEAKDGIEQYDSEINNYEILIAKGEDYSWTDLNIIYSLATMIRKYNGVGRTQ